MPYDSFVIHRPPSLLTCGTELTAFQRTWPWLGLLITISVTLVVYHGVTRNGFVLDDEDTVQRNPAVASLSSAVEWFTSPYAVSVRRDAGNYRPMLVASYALDRTLMGPEADGFHVTNLAIHLGTVVLVFILGRRFWGGLGGPTASIAALVAAFVVALHPINAEVVNYVTARSSSLTTLFVLAALWAYDSAACAGRRSGFVVAYTMGLAALGTKEAGVVLPLLIVIWDRVRRGGEERWAHTLRRSLPWWGLTAVFLLWRAGIIRDAPTATVASSIGDAGQHLLFSVKIFLSSISFWLVPIDLAVDHAWPLTIAPLEGAWLMLGVLAVASGTAVVLKRWRLFGWCFVWFWAAMLPVAALPFVSRSTLYQDNRLYLGGVALAWAVGGLVALAASRWGRSVHARAMGLAALCALAIFASVYDAIRTDVWRDDVRLWNDVLTKYPRSVIGRDTLGVLLLNSGRLDEAEREFLRALAVEPNSSHTHYYMGRVHARRESWEQAAAEFSRAIEIYPNFIRAHLGLGEAYERLGHLERAADLYEEILRRNPDVGPALVQSAKLLERRGHLEEGADRYRRVVATGQADSETVMDYGVLVLRLERWAEAEQIFSSITARDPSSYVARFNLGTALEGRGAWERAVEAYRAAAALNATDPDPFFRIGVLFSKQERWKEAAAAYDEALARNPAHVPTHLNLGILAQRLGDLPGAIGHYEAVLRTPPSRPGDEALQARARQAVAELRGGTRETGG